MTPYQQMHELGVFVHGVLAGLHLLGAVYNLRRRNWLDVGVHVGAAVYDAWAVTRHTRNLNRGSLIGFERIS